ncbi:hypothetical protein [Streptomyces sp. NPDC002403]
MLLNHTRKLAGIAVLIAGGMFLTACNSETEPSGADSVKSGQAAVSSTDTQKPDADSVKSGQGAVSSTDTQKPDSREKSATKKDGVSDANADSRADGTVTGVLTYMAPGKLVVGSRPFWIAEDTEIWGAGDICGDAAGQSASKCTVEELEKAAKTGKTKAEVAIVKGVATEIREQ